MTQELIKQINDELDDNKKTNWEKRLLLADLLEEQGKVAEAMTQRYMVAMKSSPVHFRMATSPERFMADWLAEMFELMRPTTNLAWFWGWWTGYPQEINFAAMMHEYVAHALMRIETQGSPYIGKLNKEVYRRIRKNTYNTHFHWRQGIRFDTREAAEHALMIAITRQVRGQGRIVRPEVLEVIDSRIHI